MPPSGLPTPAELATHPELAALEALAHAAELALRALVAEHPELDDPERPCWLDEPSALTARAAEVAALAVALRDAAGRYRAAARADDQRR